MRLPYKIIITNRQKYDSQIENSSDSNRIGKGAASLRNRSDCLSLPGVRVINTVMLSVHSTILWD